MSKSKTIWTTIAGVLSSFLALLGVVSCCGLPILAGILATLGIGASQLSFFAEYREWFIGFAILSLLFGFYQVYFKKKGSCCGTQSNNSCCGNESENTDKPNKPKSQLFQKIFLWIGAAIITIMLIIGANESNTVNSSNGGCCPTEELIQIQDDSGCCPAAQPTTTETQKEETVPSCCPQ
jgi:hypothetical protein